MNIQQYQRNLLFVSFVCVCVLPLKKLALNEYTFMCIQPEHLNANAKSKNFLFSLGSQNKLCFFHEKLGRKCQFRSNAIDFIVQIKFQLDKLIEKCFPSS
jgi:hypothetical protein